MSSGVEGQRDAFERQYAGLDLTYWHFHDTSDPLTRYLRDRRVRLATKYLAQTIDCTPSQLDVLIVFGGVGGEGTLLADLGFRSVTVSDFSDSALQVCRSRDDRLKTINLNAEDLDLPDACYDVVLVQDGLHHLLRPVQGFTEMLRVAKRAAVVIEPHTGVVAKVFGTEWERDGDTVNYVFRWNRTILVEASRSYLLSRASHIKALRLWDHNVVMGKVARILGGKRLGLAIVKLLYGVLDAVFPWLGNMMIGVVVVHSDSKATVE